MQQVLLLDAEAGSVIHITLEKDAAHSQISLPDGNMKFGEQVPCKYSRSFVKVIVDTAGQKEKDRGDGGTKNLHFTKTGAK